MKTPRSMVVWALLAFAGCAGTRALAPLPVTADASASVTAASEAVERSLNGKDAQAQVSAEIALGEALERAQLPVSALIHYAFAVAAAKGYESVPAVERLVALQEQLDDTLLVPNLLGAGVRKEWSNLKAADLARVQYLAAEVNLRKGKFEEARALLANIPSDVPVYPFARYLLGVVLADPRFPGGAQGEESVKAFQAALDALPAPPRKLEPGAPLSASERVRQLALLGLGRVHYALKHFSESTQAYEAVPRFSPFWDQALFENAFARFQNDDFGGSLGSLEALHAPQYEGAFQPESWILKATVYYFSCLYRESAEAMGAYDRIYQPMLESLKKYLAETHTPEELFGWVAASSSAQAPGTLPRPVLLWVRDSERIRALGQLLQALDRDEARIRQTSAWGGATSERLLAELSDNRKSIVKVAGQLSRNRLEEALRVLKNLNDQALVIRFETLKAEKEMLESGVDHEKFLQRQPLYRPQLPEEDWNYWRFQGEFWIDEIGYYQYTLKRGCPGGAAQRSDSPTAPPETEAPETPPGAPDSDDAPSAPSEPSPAP